MKNMTKRHVPILLSAVVILISCGFAQAGSAYSRFGYGLLYLRDGVKAIAMGGTGIAISDSVTIFYLNPAALASVRNTHIQGAALYDRASTTLDGNSALFHQVNVSGLGILIPLKRGYAMAFGLQPYSQVNYEMRESGIVDGKEMEQSLAGDGGLDVFYFALASTIGPVQFGVMTDFYFGLLRETWRVNFSSGDLDYTQDELATNFRGFGVHAEHHANHLLHLLLIGVAVAGDGRLDLTRRIAVHRDAALGGGQQYNATHFGQLEGGAHVERSKDRFDGHCIRSVLLEKLGHCLMNLV